MLGHQTSDLYVDSEDHGERRVVCGQASNCEICLTANVCQINQLWEQYDSYSVDRQYVSQVSARLSNTVGYSRTNVIGSRSSFVVASLRSSIH